MAEKVDYEVLKEGFILNRYYRVGDTARLTAHEAKYYLPPHDDRLALPKPKQPAPKGKQQTDA